MPKQPSSKQPSDGVDEGLFQALVTAGEAIDAESPEIALIQSGIVLAVQKGATLKELEAFCQATLEEAFRGPE